MMKGCGLKDQYGPIKSCTSRYDFIVGRSYRSNTCVFIDYTDFEAKFHLIVGDTTNFSRVNKDSKVILKKKPE